MHLNFKIMRKNIIIFISIIISSFALGSCSDFFETTLEIDPPEVKKLMTLSGFVEQDDDESLISVVRLVGIAENLQYADLEPLLDEANVVIEDLNAGTVLTFENELIDYPVNFRSLDATGFYKAGNAYKLDVSHPEYPPAFAIDTMPEKVTINEMTFFEDGGVDEFGDERSSIEFSFNDPPEKNYYEVTVLDRRSDSGNHQLESTYTSTTDPSAKRALNFNSILIDDDLFNGENKTLLIRFFRQSEERALEKIYVEFKTITRSYYEFSKRARAAVDNDENPFISPIPAFSNVEGGLGIFALYSEDLVKL